MVGLPLRIAISLVFSALFLSVLAFNLHPTTLEESHYRAPLTEQDEDRAPLDEWGVNEVSRRNIAGVQGADLPPLGLGTNLQEILGAGGPLAKFREEHGEDWQVIVNPKKGEALLLGGQTEVYDSDSASRWAQEILGLFGFSANTKIKLMGAQSLSPTSALAQELEAGQAIPLNRGLMTVFDQYIDFDERQIPVFHGQLVLHYAASGRLILARSRLRTLRRLNRETFSGVIERLGKQATTESSSSLLRRAPQLPVVYVDESGNGSCGLVEKSRVPGDDKVVVVSCQDPNLILYPTKTSSRTGL